MPAAPCPPLCANEATDLDRLPSLWGRRDPYFQFSTLPAPSWPQLLMWRWSSCCRGCCPGVVVCREDMRCAVGGDEGDIAALGGLDELVLQLLHDFWADG